MSVNDLLRKAAVLLELKQDALFNYDVVAQKKFIHKLDNPRDDMERSYFQYKCQMKFNGRMISTLLNVVSFPMALFYAFHYGKDNNVKNVSKVDAVFFRDGKPENILPPSLKKEFGFIEQNTTEELMLKKQDKKFIRKIIRRYPFSWHFILKCIIKIARYSSAIKQYQPKAIIVCAEYSFTSSMLTLYCTKNGVEHIDVMHGEKLYYMRDSFFRFDRCYVWDTYYKKIFSVLKADKKQFRVEVPESLKFTNENKQEMEYDYTYYLGAENEDVLKKIASALSTLAQQEKRISLRPHPRYSDLNQVNKLFPFANIEDTGKLTIENSLLRTGHAISLYSTVLNQALNNGIPIIIDDVSNPEDFKKLKDLKYICLKKKHEVLSEMI